MTNLDGNRRPVVLSGRGEGRRESSFLSADTDPESLILSDLPDDIRRFIASNISSVAQLEVLLLLRENREREWTAVDLGRALYMATSGMTDQLNDLASKRLAQVKHAADPLFRYGPKPGDEMDAMVDRLGNLYRERRVAVVSLIYSEPLDKARNFADAFRFRQDKEP